MKDLYDYDLVKKCSKCGIVSLKNNFYKDRTTRDGYIPSCQICTNQYYYDNRNRILNDNKIYRKNNRCKINAYEREKTNYAFKSQNNEKLIDLIGCSNIFFRKWIIYQLYGLMTLENYGTIWCLDHCINLKKTDKNDLHKYTKWINIRPMYLKDNLSKGSKIDYYLYLLQEVKSKYFLKLNNGQEGFDENIH